MTLFIELAAAYAAFRKLNGLAANQNSRRVFFTKFLELPESRLLSTYDLPEEALNKIRWITGPHAKTLYKAWRIQHEHDCQSRRDKRDT